MAPKSAPLSVEVFRAESRRPGKGTCLMVEFLKAHPAYTAATFKAIADPTITISAIYRVLKERGYQGERESVNKTRQGCVHCDKLKASCKKER